MPLKAHVVGGKLSWHACHLVSVLSVHKPGSAQLTKVRMLVQDALPVLLDLGMRAQQSVSDTPPHFSEDYLQRLVHLVQKALDGAGLNAAAHQAEAFLADRWPGTPPAGVHATLHMCVTPACLAHNLSIGVPCMVYTGAACCKVFLDCT